MAQFQQVDRTAHAVRVLLANEHKLVRAGVRALLDEQADIRVVAEAGGAGEALRLASREIIDVAVVEVDERSAPFIRELAESRGVRVLAMTATASPENMLQALRIGAAGAIPETASPHALAEAVRALARGLRWVTPDLEAYCQENLSTPAQEAAKPAQTRTAAWERLTPREQQVAELVGQGLRHGEIGESLGISIHTVKNHLRHIFLKLDVTGRVELALYVRR